MRAIIGLGNPGAQYAHTRHNAGFDVLDILSEKLDIPIKKLKCRATVGEGHLDGDRVALIKPQTFMNLSGLSVADALSWYKLEPQDVLIVVDDIDLPFGQVRLRAKGSAGTHNGLRSIVQCTGRDDFPRVRIGMGAPPKGFDLADYVLGHFNTDTERETVLSAYALAAQAAMDWLKNGIDHAMNHYNKKNAEPTV